MEFIRSDMSGSTEMCHAPLKKYENELFFIFPLKSHCIMPKGLSFQFLIKNSRNKNCQCYENVFFFIS